MTHTILPTDGLTRKSYCKWHNSSSHATNDCNVFHRQIQSGINESRLKFQKMWVDKQPFTVNFRKILSRKVVAKKTPDGGETLKINIKSANTRGRRRRRTGPGPMFCVSWMVWPLGADSLDLRRTVRLARAVRCNLLFSRK
jgi:hypothetical protein